MNIYAIVNGINSLCSLAIVLIIFFRRGFKAVHLTYAWFSLLIFIWTFSYFIWGLQTEQKTSLAWLRLLFFPVCFLQVSYFHFYLVFSEKLKRYKWHLITGYFLSSLFAIINSKYGLFDLSYVRNLPPFPFWPHGTRWIFMLMLSHIYFVGLAWVVMYQSLSRTNEPARSSHKLFLLMGILGWSGGLMNWFYFFDATPIPPIGNAGITIFLLGTFYLIYKHDIFGLNIAIRRTFIYACLTFFITCTYIIFILISEKIFQSYFGYSSLVASVLAGTTIAVLFNPVKDFFGRFIDKTFFGKGIVALSTENSLMRNALTQQNQMKSVATLAAGMAHEIKNPLTAIKTFTEHLPKNADNKKFVEKYTKLVSSEVSKIDGIVRQVLEFSKPDPLRLEKLDIREVLNQTLDLLGSEFVKYRIQIDRRLGATPLLVSGDRKQLKQAFLNLFLNSIQAMPKGGKITVSGAQMNGHGIQISISDTGCGIPAKDLPHIFDPFYTTKESGTGLGLSIVHGIIKEHGGSIRVTSLPETKTSFEIVFNAH